MPSFPSICIEGIIISLREIYIFLMKNKAIKNLCLQYLPPGLIPTLIIKLSEFDFLTL